MVKEWNTALHPVRHGHLVQAHQQQLRQPLLELEIADPPEVLIGGRTERARAAGAGRTPAEAARNMIGDGRAWPARAPASVESAGPEDPTLQPLGEPDLQADEDRLPAGHSFEVV